ncbi:DegT/DnrJ/EryC1/StrS family aminotransferase [Nonomuraea sp. NPDC004580]|uniref:DegT/DnrJ/EryC1/StrS family aminotransferase n=1 Tax=Nonomuraea sp. NPDC004580 TaxID=3154552 RepID=UPI0033ABB354
MLYTGRTTFTVPNVSPYRLGATRQSEFMAVMESVTETGTYRSMTGWSAQIAGYVAAELRLPDSWEVLPTRSGTDALVMALTMAGVRPGDLVAAPDLAYHAVGAAISQVGAVPRWIDVGSRTLNLDVADLAAACQAAAVAAVIAVDNYGTPCDRAGIARVCGEHAIPFVLDACESLGAAEAQENAGHQADFVALSFSFTKPIHAAGMGGALCAPRPVVEDRAGRPELLTYPRRLPELNAAYLALAWPDLPAVVDKLRLVYDAYCEQLVGTGLRGQDDGGRSNRLHAPFLLPPGSGRSRRDALISRLAEVGLEIRPYFESQSRLWDMPSPERSADLAQRVLCLPTGAGFPLEQLETVTAEVVRGLEARQE